MNIRSKIVRSSVAVAGILAVCAAVYAQAGRAMSPQGSATAHVQGKWTNPGKQTFALGGGTYEGGKWIEITYGRPLKRGRDVFGSGADYGKATLIGAPIWRAGANVTTQLTTEVPLRIGAVTVTPGTYTLFVDLKENNWTFVVSKLVAQAKYDPNEKVAVWGGYNYTPDKDVVRAKMKLDTLPHAHEELSWEFVDMTAAGGTIALTWDKTQALVPFTFGR